MVFFPESDGHHIAWLGRYFSMSFFSHVSTLGSTQSSLPLVASNHYLVAAVWLGLALLAT